MSGSVISTTLRNDAASQVHCKLHREAVVYHEPSAVVIADAKTEQRLDPRGHISKGIAPCQNHEPVAHHNGVNCVAPRVGQLPPPAHHKPHVRKAGTFHLHGKAATLFRSRERVLCDALDQAFLAQTSERVAQPLQSVFRRSTVTAACGGGLEGAVVHSACSLQRALFEVRRSHLEPLKHKLANLRLYQKRYAALHRCNVYGAKPEGGRHFGPHYRVSYRNIRR
mmetsp:Transcript_85464/g.171118  ORF Transcript_85464/g.171118 Transcript_85464/m.171118 type:complete len:224 (-) Transcript_85464:176-847(-)